MNLRDEWAASSLRRVLASSPRLSLAAGAVLVGFLSTAWLLLQPRDPFSGYDFLRMHFFYKAYLRDAVLAGRLPLWNPNIGLGRPFLADIETATFYPPGYLVVPFGVLGGVALGMVFHQALAIYCGVRLGRYLGAGNGASWLLGFGLAMAGPFAGRLQAGLVEGYAVLCWWPALLWLGARLQDRWEPRVAGALALATAMAILAGHPPILYAEGLGVAVFLVLRQDWSRAAAAPFATLVAAVVLGAGIAAVQVLPFLELVGQGNRPIHPASLATRDGIAPGGWLSLILPGSVAFPVNWEYNLYCGLPLLFAAAAAVPLWRDRNARALIGLGLVGAVFAAGDRTPILGWALHVLPGASALRIPSRYGLWLAFALLGMGALGVTRRPAQGPLAVLAGLVLSLAGVAWLGSHTQAAPHALFGFLGMLAVSLLVSAALVWAWLQRRRWPRLAAPVGVALAAFYAADLLRAAMLQSSVYGSSGAGPSEHLLHNALASARLFPESGVPPRVSFDPADVRENAGMVGGFSTFDSYTAPALDRVWTYLHVATGAAPSSIDFIQLPVEIHTRVPALRSLSLAGSLDPGGRMLRVNPAPDPRAYVSLATEPVAGWRAAEARMADGADFHGRALVDPLEAPEGLPTGEPGLSRAEVIRFLPERVSVRTHAPRPGVLVLSEAWYPGWTALVGGAPAQVFPVNGWMRGVEVPAGETETVFEFHSTRLLPGLFVSAICFGAALLLLSRPARRGGA